MLAFLLTDIEGSTRLWQQAPEGMPRAIARHDNLLRDRVEHNRGRVLKERGEGDSVFAVFRRPSDAVLAAVESQRALHAQRWPEGISVRVRMAINVGEAGPDYRGTAVNRCARLRALAVGGQVLISQSTRTVIGDVLPEGVGLVDLGDLRLRDLALTERVYQLTIAGLPSDFPTAPEARMSNLPLQLTAFVGRQTEMIVIKQLLRENRLVTLTGAGGIGKTRLAIEVARQLLDEFKNGVYLVELAPLADPHFVAEAVGSALNLREQPPDSLTQTLSIFLESRQMLLLLDNCEHMVEAVAALAETLLSRCPNLRLLTTSRERLSIRGERTWQVSPLHSPDPKRVTVPGELMKYEAIQLFSERAVGVQPSFILTPDNAREVAQLCQHLDGMPLALELAAAHTAVLSPKQIAARLDDRFRLFASGSRTGLARHQTLRATVEWSHNLLNGGERCLFRRLSVFTGSFSLEAVEAVCSGDGLASESVVGLCRRLVETSLVLTEEGSQGRRYRLLETLRQYSRERLVEAGELDRTCSRLADYLVVLAEDGDRKARGAESASWLVQMEEEHDNLRAALDWSSEADQESNVALAMAWVPFWIARGYVREGYERLRRSISEGTLRTGLRPLALNAAGRLAMWRGDFQSARPLFEEILPWLRRNGPPDALASVLINYDAVLLGQGDRSDRPYLQEALAVSRQSGLTSFLAIVLNNLGETKMLAGDSASAASHYQESLAIFREIESLWGVATVLYNLALLELRQDNFAVARLHLCESLAISHRRGDRLWIATSLLLMANIAACDSPPERAVRLAGAAESVRLSVGIARNAPAFLFREEMETGLQRAKEILGPGSAAGVWEEGSRLSLDRAVEYALAEEPVRVS